MAGYSQTPLAKKLGINDGMTISFIAAPNDLWAELGELPSSVTVRKKPATDSDLILYFTASLEEYTKQFPIYAKLIAQAGMLWIGWPKKASKIETDIGENLVREIGLANGLVDVKVCAITEQWSGLKFVRRLKDRTK